MKNLKDISNGLTEIRLIRNKATLRDQILGKKFNLFRILKKGHEEVSLHSAFLGELLNPNGSHKNGNDFLSLFIKEIVNNTGVVFDETANYRVSVEKTFEHGRMDIVIENEKNCIIIENKIYAKDQNEQLARYYEYAKNKKFETRKILYLNLWGTDPSENSTKFNNHEMPKDKWGVISYRKDILHWLKLCSIKAIDKAYIRENIQQYSDLIKELTNTMEDSMSDEIKKYITNEMNVESLNQINLLLNSIGELRIEKIKKYLKEISKSKIFQGKPPALFVNENAKQPLKWKWDIPARLAVTIDNKVNIEINIWTEYGYSGTYCLVKPILKENNEAFLEHFKEKIDINKGVYFDLPIENLDFYFKHDWIKQEFLDEQIEKTILTITNIINEIKLIKFKK